MNNIYHQTCTNLNSLDNEKLKKWFDSFDTVITDCDGVLWEDYDLIEGSDKVINCFKNLGRKVFFATNNCSRTREDYVIKATNLGFNIEKDNIISTSYVAAKYLSNLKFNKKVYIVGPIGVGKELDKVGIQHSGIGPDELDNVKTISTKFTPDPNVGAVIVGYDLHLSLPKIMKAGYYLQDPNCIFIGTCRDERFYFKTGTVLPGTGGFIKAVETFSQRKAVIIGKPDRHFCHELLANYDVQPNRSLMIGDRCNTDILLGYNCGFQTLLVGTGVHNLNDVERLKQSKNMDDKKQIPDVYISSLGNLLPILNRIHV